LGRWTVRSRPGLLAPLQANSPHARAWVPRGAARGGHLRWSAWEGAGGDPEAGTERAEAACLRL